MQVAGCYNSVDELNMPFGALGGMGGMNNDEMLRTIYETVVNQNKQASKGERTTFREYGKKWFDTRKNSVLETTYNKYCILYDKHLLPFFGGYTLAQIDRAMVQSYVNALEEKGYSLSTIKAIKAQLSSILKLAVSDDYITKNPCDTVTLPKIEQQKKAPATLEEFKEFMEVSKGSPFHIAVPMLFLTGLRRGEILALTWDDIDFKANLIKVHREYVIENGTGKAVMREHTKTEAGMRQVPIIPVLKSCLRKQKAIDGDKHYILYQHRTGKDWPVYPSEINANFRRWEKELNRKHGFTPHSARHYYASTLLRKGMSPEELRKLTGHKDITTLLDIYCYNDKIDDASMERAAKLLNDEVSA